MLKLRVIPCLDVKDGRVVKGVNFVSLRDAGDPVEQAAVYDAAGADELTFLEVEFDLDGVENRVVDLARPVQIHQGGPARGNGRERCHEVFLSPLHEFVSMVSNPGAIDASVPART